jgi:3',5'-cyclic AMP phosphodiesterase CpdA
MECSRRLFIEGIGALTAVSVAGCKSPKKGELPLMRFGLVTDCHYADIPYAKREHPIGDAAYRETLAKLRECVAVMDSERPSFLIELGDFKDQGPDKASTIEYLDKVEAVFSRFSGPRYHVLGNHDLDLIDKSEFLSRIKNYGQDEAQAHYSFEVSGIRFIVLDACYNSKLEDYVPGNWDWTDANVPPDQLAWLEAELASAPGQVVVFGHQCLDPNADSRHQVRNAAAVRAILEKSGKVNAVFTGHQHSGLVSCVNGITYYSLRAMVLNSGENGYAVADIYPSGGIKITGFRKAASADIPGIA